MQNIHLLEQIALNYMVSNRFQIGDNQLSSLDQKLPVLLFVSSLGHFQQDL